MKSWGDYFYPGTKVLQNVPGLRDPAALEKFERTMSGQQARSLKISPAKLRTPNGFKEIHKHLLGKVYPFAGVNREVDMSKGGTDFLPAAHIDRGLEQTMKQFNKALPPEAIKAIGEKAKTDAKGAAAELALKIAPIVGELNYVHPFREGNGRTTRAFVSLVAKQAGLELNQQKLDRRMWVEGAIESTINPERTGKLAVALVDAIERPGTQHRSAGPTPKARQQQDRDKDQGR